MRRFLTNDAKGNDPFTALMDAYLGKIALNAGNHTDTLTALDRCRISLLQSNVRAANDHSLMTGA